MLQKYNCILVYVKSSRQSCFKVTSEHNIVIKALANLSISCIGKTIIK